jgi:hypothetical protein
MPLPLSTDVSVTVNLSNPGVTRAGFGIPMVLSNTGNAWATPELTRRYARGGFSTDFPSDTVEYAILTAIFSQPSPPPVVVVGKGSNKPTMVRTILVQSAVNGATYKVNAFCNGTLWSAEYTAGADTAAQIAEALVDLLSPDAWAGGVAYALGDRATNDSGKIYQATQAGTSDLYGMGPTGTGAGITDGSVVWEYVVTPTFTASDSGTSTITATGNAAGSWFALEPIATGDPAAVSNLMKLTDTSTDPSGNVSGDLANILLADSSWYALILAFKSAAILDTAVTGVAAWCESNGRLLVASVSDTACATAAYAGGTDVLHALTAANGRYTAPQWHPRDYEFLDACTAGYFLPIEPGSDNWRMKGLIGPTPVDFTTTQAGVAGSNLDDRRAGYFSTLGGQNVLAGAGQVENTTYGFIDTVRNIDWYTTNLQDDLINNNKLPNTNAGRRVIANAIASRNAIGIQKGVISPDPLDPTNAQAPVMEPFTVFMPDVSDSSSFDPATRALSGVETAWKLANPINSMSVTVTVTQ